MKRVLQTALIMTMLIVTASSFAQIKSQDANKTTKAFEGPKTYLDLMINVVSTNLNYGGANSGLADYKKSSNGLQAGAAFQAGITKHFSLVTELYFIRKGGELKSNNPLTMSRSSLHLNTIELPVLARFHFGRYYMNAGPSLAYNLSGTQKIENAGTKLSFANSAEGFKRLDAGVQAGAGVEFPFKQKRIGLDIRYSYGLSNISYAKNIHNRAVMVSVHYSKAWKQNPLATNQIL